MQCAILKPKIEDMQESLPQIVTHGTTVQMASKLTVT